MFFQLDVCFIDEPAILSDTLFHDIAIQTNY